jgi:hypothetical protein
MSAGIRNRFTTKMEQRALAMAADQDDRFEPHRRPTGRGTFLATTQQLVPGQELRPVVEPHYPKAGNGGPATVSTMGGNSRAAA